MHGKNQQRKEVIEKRAALYGYQNIDKKIICKVHKQTPSCPFDHTQLYPHIKKDKQSYLWCKLCGGKFVYSDENTKCLKKEKDVYYNLTYFYNRSRKKLQSKSHIQLGSDSVLIYGNSFDCAIPGHKTERILIDIPIKSADEISLPTGIAAAYCPECQAYYILDHIYKMYEHSQIACHVYSKQQARRLLRDKNVNESDAKSILMEHGYSVSKVANLPASERHRILRVVIKTGSLSPKEVENYLRMFIEQHKNISSNREAVAKWREDLDYVIRYSEEIYGQINTYR